VLEHGGFAGDFTPMVGKLRVISRTSVMRFKQTKKPLQTAGLFRAPA
jgi:hypothetical protein